MANDSSSFVNPVASFPNRIATLPSFAASVRETVEVFCETLADAHASRTETIGKFSRGRAVVAATKTQSATAASAVSNRPASRRRCAACTAMIRASSAKGAVDRSFAEWIARSDPSSISASKGGASAPGSGATTRRSVMPKLFITRAMPPTFAGPWGRHSTKQTLESREVGDGTGCFPSADLEGDVTSVVGFPSSSSSPSSRLADAAEGRVAEDAQSGRRRAAVRRRGRETPEERARPPEAPRAAGTTSAARVATADIAAKETPRTRLLGARRCEGRVEQKANLLFVKNSTRGTSQSPRQQRFTSPSAPGA